jgi:hypothetical protein
VVHLLRPHRPRGRRADAHGFIFGASAGPRALATWILPCGVVGPCSSPPGCGGQAERNREHGACALIFTPLFALLLLVSWHVAFTAAASHEAETLIASTCCSCSWWACPLRHLGRDPKAGRLFRCPAVSVVCALLVDAMALWAIVARISAFGFSPNKVAALGENIVLVVNLGWSAMLYWRFLAKRGGFAALERWQTSYLPVYAVWALIVVVVFPVVFGFK